MWYWFGDAFSPQLPFKAVQVSERVIGWRSIWNNLLNLPYFISIICRCPICPESFHVEFLLDRHMQAHQLGKANRPAEPHHQYLSNLMPKRSLGIPPSVSPLMANQFHMKHPPYPPHILNQLYMTNAMAREHSLLWARNDFRQRVALASPKMDYYHHQEPQLPVNHDKENGKESLSSNNNESNFGGDTQETTSSEPEVNQQRKIGHSIKTGVSLRCAYCNGDFRSR